MEKNIGTKFVEAQEMLQTALEEEAFEISKLLKEFHDSTGIIVRDISIKSYLDEKAQPKQQTFDVTIDDYLIPGAR